MNSLADVYDIKCPGLLTTQNAIGCQGLALELTEADTGGE